MLISQQNHVISNIFRGSLVGLGWGAGVTSGSISDQIFFDCSDCTEIGNVYVIGIESKKNDTLDFLDKIFYLNSSILKFDTFTRIGQKFGPWPVVNNHFVYQLHLLKFDLACNGTNFFSISAPPQDLNTNIINFYFLFECIDNTDGLISYSLVLNTADTNLNLEIPSSESIPIIPQNNPSDVGFSIIGGVMNNMTNDASIVSFNGYDLGRIGGIDVSSSAYFGTGVRGHFLYSNGVLQGLDDDTPDLIMDSTDALANVQSYIGSSNDFYFSCVHEQPATEYAYYTNPVLAGILVHTPLCDTFAVSVPNDTTVCFGSQLQLNVNGGVTYEWYPSTNLSCSDCPNPIFTADTSVFYTVKIWNNDSCFVSRPLKLNVLPEIVFESIVVSPSECGLNSGTVFFPYMGNGYSFTHVGGATMNNIGNFQNLGTGFYTFYAQNASGCQSADTTVFIPEINSSNVNFTANPLAGASPLEVNFTNTSSNASVFEWFVNSESLGANLPSLILEQEGNYIVQLVGWQTNETCADTAIITIHVYDSLIVHLPNVFTPNADGVNDTFTFQSNQDVRVEYSILNRWGNEILVKSFEIVSSIPTVLWDGTSSVNTESPEGVYFIQLKITNKKGEQIEMNEFITLER